MVQSVLRYLTYTVIAVALFSACMGPLFWFVWIDLAHLNSGGTKGSLILLLLGALTLILYAGTLLSYPFAARGHAKILRLLELLGSKFGFGDWKIFRWAKSLPWLLSCLHFVLVPLLGILPLIGFVETKDIFTVIVITLLAVAGTGILHHVAFAIARKFVPEPPGAEDPQEEALRSLLPGSR